MADEPVLEIIEDLAGAELHERACGVCSGKGWYFGHGSHDHDAVPFWKMDLDGDAVFDEIWGNVRERCEALAGGPLRVVRQYANGHTYGLGGKPHPDDVRPGSYTLLYYPMAEWQDGWDGETVFFDEHGEIALAVRPRPNRAVFFDSRILHAGRAPSRACPALRVTVAYKLERADIAGEAPPAAHTEWSVDEVSRQGATRVWRVRLSASMMQRLMSERLEEIARTVRLPGFRPGKIPAAVIQERYGAKAQAEVLERVASQAGAHVLARGGIASDMKASHQGGGVEFLVTATHLPDLPEFDPETIELERLTSHDPAHAEALAGHLRQQVLDRLDAAFDFPLASAMVDREYAAIRAAAAQQGSVTEEIEAELKVIAERRVRLGAVVTELARRWELGRDRLEDRVVERILQLARVRERAATAEELADL